MTNKTLLDADAYTSCVLIVTLSIISLLDRKRSIRIEEIITEIYRQVKNTPEAESDEAKYVQTNAHKMVHDLCENLHQRLQ